MFIALENMEREKKEIKIVSKLRGLFHLPCSVLCFANGVEK